MPQNLDGSFACDGSGCGTDIGNGGIGTALQLIDYHEGAQRHRRLCYSRGLDEDDQPLPGCRDEILGGLLD